MKRCIFLILSCLIMTCPVFAEWTLQDGTLTYSREEINSYRRSYTQYSNGQAHRAPPVTNVRTTSGPCFAGCDGNYSTATTTISIPVPGISYISVTPYNIKTVSTSPLVKLDGTDYFYTFGNVVCYALVYTTGSYKEYALAGNPYRFPTTGSFPYTETSVCNNCGEIDGVYHGTISGSSGYIPSSYGRTSFTTTAKTYTYPAQDTSTVVYPKALVVKNCTYNGTLISSIPASITGGQYEGAPALNSTNITVNKGQLTDKGGTKSKFMLGEDSEQTVVKDETNNTTITTVKLSNPPIIIDWADFPG